MNTGRQRELAGAAALRLERTSLVPELEGARKVTSVSKAEENRRL